MSSTEENHRSIWFELIGSKGLENWGLLDAQMTGVADWNLTGGVQLNPENPKLLVSEDGGSSIIVNGPTGKTENILSKLEFGDIEVHIEYLIPEKSNSGVYFMGRYEIQVLDSWGKDPAGTHDNGAIYPRWDPERGEGKEGYEGHAPRINASRRPGEWQTFDVIFRAPKFDSHGIKTHPAEFVKVVHNGSMIHEHVKLSGPTRAAAFEDESSAGPLMLQGDHGPVAYRNIRIQSLE